MFTLFLAFFAAPALPPDWTPISSIQGLAGRSPLVGSVVTTAGVVTAVRPSSFYIQSPPEWADGDPRTSEGLLIFLGSAPPAHIVPGALVKVRGTVTEFVPASDPGSPPLTELTRIVETAALDGEAELPVPVELTRAMMLSPGGFAALEPYEGMRVRTGRLIVTSPSTSGGILFGVLPGFARPLRTAEAATVPERLRIDSNRVLPPASAGMSFSELAGVLDFGQRAWTLVATAGGTLSPSPYPRPALAPPAAREISIASLNCERFFDSVDDPGVSDTVLSDASYSARRTKLVRFVLATLHSPDVLALMEIENLRVLQELADNINSTARENGLPDPNYRAYLEEGTDPGGIDVGFLVKTARVEPIDVFQWGRQDTYIRPDGRMETLNERPPLTLYAKVENRDFIVIANHFRSMTDIEDAVSGPRIRLKRRLQAEQLRELVARLTADNPGTPLAAMGDFNAFAFPNLPDDDPLSILRGPLELLTTRLPPAQTVSYSFQGLGQTLDHVLANREFAANVTRLAYTSINTTTAEFERLNYEVPDRFSDHEALVVYYSLETPILSPMMVRPFLSPFTGAVAPGSAIEVATRAVPFGRDILQAPRLELPSYTLTIGRFSTEIALTPAAPSIANAGLINGELWLLATGIGRWEPYVSVGPHVCELRSVLNTTFAGVSEIRAECPSNIPSGVDLPVHLVAAETAAIPAWVRK